MRSSAAKKRILTAAAIFISVAIVSLAVADLVDKRMREHRERAVYGTVLTAAASFDVSPAMILAVISTESDFKPDALSSVGAIGLMQLMPDTFAFLRDERLKEDIPDDAIWQRDVNIRYGTYYLSYLFDRFGSWHTALAAYNAGEGRVADWLKDPLLSDGITLFRIPFEETENYVTVTLEAYRHYLEKYSFKE